MSKPAGAGGQQALASVVDTELQPILDAGAAPPRGGGVSAAWAISIWQNAVYRSYIVNLFLILSW